MTATDTRSGAVRDADVPLVTVDMFRDIHKAIRSELFGVTLAAGRVSPLDTEGRAEVARHVVWVRELLSAHAEHEATHVEPVLAEHLPEMGEVLAREHAAIEARLDELVELARRALAADGPAARVRTHRLYLDLAEFTARFLDHEDYEERRVGPAIEAVLGPEGAAVIQEAIVSGIQPAQRAASLAVMLPALNVDDRAEVLGGLRAGAPAEVFAGAWALAESVLTPAQVHELSEALGL